ncbi:hypothetical protein V6N11_017040 [Hibiscus sabdariffa]|uniref:Uncharacterized protein n=1 Tax=Hibiscus sabdariffa TaxID=183260 RepID=A0ABR2TX55_9ROSI
MTTVTQFVMYGLAATGTSVASIFLLGTLKLAKDYAHVLATYSPTLAYIFVALTVFLIFMWHFCPCPSILYTASCLGALAFRNFMNNRDRNNDEDDAARNVEDDVAATPTQADEHPTIGIAADVSPTQEQFPITAPHQTNVPAVESVENMATTTREPAADFIINIPDDDNVATTPTHVDEHPIIGIAADVSPPQEQFPITAPHQTNVPAVESVENMATPTREQAVDFINIPDDDNVPATPTHADEHPTIGIASDDSPPQEQFPITAPHQTNVPAVESVENMATTTREPAADFIIKIPDDDNVATTPTHADENPIIGIAADVSPPQKQFPITAPHQTNVPAVESVENMATPIREPAADFINIPDNDNVPATPTHAVEHLTIGIAADISPPQEQFPITAPHQTNVPTVESVENMATSTREPAADFINIPDHDNVPATPTHADEHPTIGIAADVSPPQEQFPITAPHQTNVPAVESVENMATTTREPAADFIINIPDDDNVAATPTNADEHPTIGIAADVSPPQEQFPVTILHHTNVPAIESVKNMATPTREPAADFINIPDDYVPATPTHADEHPTIGIAADVSPPQEQFPTTATHQTNVPAVESVENMTTPTREPAADFINIPTMTIPPQEQFPITATHQTNVPAVESVENMATTTHEPAADFIINIPNDDNVATTPTHADEHPKIGIAVDVSPPQEQFPITAPHQTKVPAVESVENMATPTREPAADFINIPDDKNVPPTPTHADEHPTIGIAADVSPPQEQFPITAPHQTNVPAVESVENMATTTRDPPQEQFPITAPHQTNVPAVESVENMATPTPEPAADFINIPDDDNVPATPTHDDEHPTIGIATDVSPPQEQFPITAPHQTNVPAVESVENMATTTCEPAADFIINIPDDDNVATTPTHTDEHPTIGIVADVSRPQEQFPITAPHQTNVPAVESIENMATPTRETAVDFINIPDDDNIPATPTHTDEHPTIGIATDVSPPQEQFHITAPHQTNVPAVESVENMATTTRDPTADFIINIPDDNNVVATPTHADEYPTIGIAADVSPPQEQFPITAPHQTNVPAVDFVENMATPTREPAADFINIPNYDNVPATPTHADEHPQIGIAADVSPLQEQFPITAPHQTNVPTVKSVENMATPTRDPAADVINIPDDDNVPATPTYDDEHPTIGIAADVSPPQEQFPITALHQTNVLAVESVENMATTNCEPAADFIINIPDDDNLAATPTHADEHPTIGIAADVSPPQEQFPITAPHQTNVPAVESVENIATPTREPTADFINIPDDDNVHATATHDDEHPTIGIAADVSPPQEQFPITATHQTNVPDVKSVENMATTTREPAADFILNIPDDENVAPTPTHANEHPTICSAANVSPPQEQFPITTLHQTNVPAVESVENMATPTRKPAADFINILDDDNVPATPTQSNEHPTIGIAVDVSPPQEQFPITAPYQTNVPAVESVENMATTTREPAADFIINIPDDDNVAATPTHTDEHPTIGIVSDVSPPQEQFPITAPHQINVPAVESIENMATPSREPAADFINIPDDDNVPATPTHADEPPTIGITTDVSPPQEQFPITAPHQTNVAAIESVENMATTTHEPTADFIINKPDDDNVAATPTHADEHPTIGIAANVSPPQEQFPITAPHQTNVPAVESVENMATPTLEPAPDSINIPDDDNVPATPTHADEHPTIGIIADVSPPQEQFPITAPHQTNVPTVESDENMAPTTCEPAADFIINIPTTTIRPQEQFPITAPHQNNVQAVESIENMATTTRESAANFIINIPDGDNVAATPTHADEHPKIGIAADVSPPQEQFPITAPHQTNVPTVESVENMATPTREPAADFINIPNDENVPATPTHADEHPTIGITADVSPPQDQFPITAPHKTNVSAVETVENMAITTREPAADFIINIPDDDNTNVPAVDSVENMATTTREPAADFINIPATPTHADEHPTICIAADAADFLINIPDDDNVAATPTHANEYPTIGIAVDGSPPQELFPITIPHPTNVLAVESVENMATPTREPTADFINILDDNVPATPTHADEHPTIDIAADVSPPQEQFPIIAPHQTNVPAV